MKQIEHVAVIGAGIMGGHLAAFFANAGMSCDIYDINPAIIQKTMEVIASPKTKPPVLYTPNFARRIQGRLMDELGQHLKKADMVVEAVPERMDLKQKIFKMVDECRRDDTIVTTNTSGLSVNQMIAGLSDSMSSHFVGTHYFNPVRFLPLVEIIPAKNTRPELVAFLEKFFEKAGKKVVMCKDTPNFIANRVGIFSLMKTLGLMEKYGFGVETVDMITGTPLGNPNTATLRLSDMVGIDTILEVARNVYENCPGDECRDIFKPPAWLERMVAEKMLGEKTGKGFYQKGPNREILSLDIGKWEYRGKQSTKSDVVKVAKGYQKIQDRIFAMVNGDAPVNRFCQEIVLSCAAYAMNRVGEIAEDIKTIDDAMKWGFRREIGPIESLDAIGLPRAREWMNRHGIAVPRLMEEILAGPKRIYRSTAMASYCYDVKSKDMKFSPPPVGISLQHLKADNKVLRENLSARLIDLGDRVLLMELDHKMVPGMNPVDDSVLTMFSHIPDIMEEGKFKALVIGNQGEHFCAGAQLQMIQELALDKKWKMIELASSNFQMANMALYHADFPVVVAPHGMTLGGGMEITLSGHKRVALSEFYGGLVEVGVGLLPGGAGNLLLVLQFMDALASANPGPMPPSTKAFELIAYGSVSSSAHDAVDKGFLNRDDTIVINKEEQISKAKEVALSMVDGHRPKPLRELYLAGPGGCLVLTSMIDDLVVAGKVTEHSAVIAKKQAYVLTGGKNASITTPITEEHFLALEREAFVQLCAEKKTQERIAYMLEKKKPLIN